MQKPTFNSFKIKIFYQKFITKIYYSIDKIFIKNQIKTSDTYFDEENKLLKKLDTNL